MDTHLSTWMVLPDTTQRRRLEWESGDALRKSLMQEQPAAYVVRTHDLKLLPWSEDVIVDRGWKHPAKGLAAVLLGKKKIPLIRGRYSEPGQLRRSVRTLLAHAAARGERNAYIIGVEDPLFDILWQEDSAALPRRLAPGPRPYAPEPLPSLDHRAWETALSDLVQLPVPDSLVAAYVGVSAHTRLVRQLILHAARSLAPVLIIGPAGSGKDVVARCIHDLRGRQPFMPINCAALPHDLIESELFGHVAGAFTGAVKARDGVWKQAGDGTLFLDEIGDAPGHLQPKLLRALEEKKIRPLGTTHEIAAPARIISATSRDLATMIRTGEFRFELYCRLSVLVIATVPLGQRVEDVSELAQFFWRQLTDGGTLPPDVVGALESYPWPGNVRELRNVLDTLHALFGTESLGPKQLQTALQLHELPMHSGRPPLFPPLDQ